jgi:histidinol-phosphate aminotransferase
MRYTSPAEHPALAPRDAIRALPPYSAGRDAAAVRRDTGYQGPVVKLASNEGAEGPFPAARAALETVASSVQRYPDAYALPVSEALARFHQVGTNEVMVGGSGCAVLAHLSSAFLEVGDEVVFGQPTFHVYRLEALRMGATPSGVPLKGDGTYDLSALRNAVGPKTRLVYLCTPNNPTGGLIRRAELAAFVNDLPERVLPIIDEAYFEYVDHPDYPDPVRVARPYDRPVVVLRTFSKIYGLAGLRIGYAIAPEAVIATCRRIQNPYEVTRAAQVAALASLEHPEDLARRREQNTAGRSRLFAGLRELGFEPFPSQGNFACVRVGGARIVAKELEARGVIVRPLDAMGDPTSIRITVGTPEEINTFLATFAEVLRSVPSGSTDPQKVRA